MRTTTAMAANSKTFLTQSLTFSEHIFVLVPLFVAIFTERKRLFLNLASRQCGNGAIGLSHESRMEQTQKQLYFRYSCGFVAFVIAAGVIK